MNLNEPFTARHRHQERHLHRRRDPRRSQCHRHRRPHLHQGSHRRHRHRPLNSMAISLEKFRAIMRLHEITEDKGKIES